MSDFEDNLAGIGLEFLTEFGETVTYHPAGGSDRSILAIVERSGPAGLDGLPMGKAERLDITVLNDGTDGIDSADLNTGGDYVTVAARIGDTAGRRRITRVLAQDTDMIRVELL